MRQFRWGETEGRLYGSELIAPMVLLAVTTPIVSDAVNAGFENRAATGA